METEFALKGSNEKGRFPFKIPGVGNKQGVIGQKTIVIPIVIPRPPYIIPLPVTLTARAKGEFDLNVEGGITMKVLRSDLFPFEGEFVWRAGQEENSSSFFRLKKDLMPKNDKNLPRLINPDSWGLEAKANVGLNFRPGVEVSVAGLEAIPWVQEQQALARFSTYFRIGPKIDVALSMHNDMEMRSAFGNDVPDAGFTKFDVGIMGEVSATASTSLWGAKPTIKSEGFGLIWWYRLPVAELQYHERNDQDFYLRLKFDDHDSYMEVDRSKNQFELSFDSEATIEKPTSPSDPDTSNGSWDDPDNNSKRAKFYARFTPTDESLGHLSQYRHLFTQYVMEETGFLLEGVWGVRFNKALLTVANQVWGESGKCGGQNKSPTYVQYIYDEDSRRYTEKVIQTNAPGSMAMYKQSTWVDSVSYVGDGLQMVNYSAYKPSLSEGKYFYAEKVHAGSCFAYNADGHWYLDDDCPGYGVQIPDYECVKGTNTIKTRVLAHETDRLVTMSYLRSNFIKPGMTMGLPDELQGMEGMPVETVFNEFVNGMVDSMITSDHLGFKSKVDLNDSHDHFSVVSSNGIFFGAFGAMGSREYFRCGEGDAGCLPVMSSVAK